MSDVKYEACKGNGDQPIIKITTKRGASATIYLHGATVTSYKDINGKERLFTSKQAVFDGKKAIRGGIPLVFPQFGASTTTSTRLLPSHGFARTSQWKFDGIGTTSATTSGDGATNDETTTALFSMVPTPAIRTFWDYDFKLLYEVTINSFSLTTRLTVINTGTVSFDFQVLLHTYYKVDCIHNVRVRGLNGVEYVDKLRNSTSYTEVNDEISIVKEIDSIYTKAPYHCAVVNKEDDNVFISITRTTTDTTTATATTTDATTTTTDATTTTTDAATDSDSDFVVWNPWINKSKGMGDFGDEEYLNMLCIEPGYVKGWKKLLMGESWFLEQNIEFN